MSSKMHLSMFVYPNIPLLRYDNTPIQYTAIFYGCKKGNFRMKNCDICFALVTTIDY